MILKMKQVLLKITEIFFFMLITLVLGSLNIPA